MMSTLVRVISLIIVILACHPEIGRSPVKAASWLDNPKPASWNKRGLSIPTAHAVQDSPDPRCREQARPSELKEDKLLRDQGWNLVGAYQGGWQITVIRGTAGYDGMCRPQQYQGFVFVRGVFAGTLSPEAMDSRTDGSLTQVSVLSEGRLTAEYVRYSAKDAACCPSSTTRVEFEIASDGPVARPVSASTSPNQR